MCTPDLYVKDFFKSKCVNGKVLLALNSDKIKNLNQRWSQTRKSLDTPGSGRKNFILEKWFPLQGERAHFLLLFFVCMIIERLETEQ